MRTIQVTSLMITVLICVAFPFHPAAAQLQVGAAVTDITPKKLPVIVNGGFVERQSDRVTDRLHVRCLVISDGKTKIVIAVADSCMIPRDVCDQIKRQTAEQTGIPTKQMLIAATHTHSAPSLMDFCLGARRDKTYTKYFVTKVAESIVAANDRLVPAEAGWTVTKAPKHTFCRRWIRRPDRVGVDPFGERTVRAMMHPGYQNKDFLGPAGPVDSELALLSFRSLDGKPICLLANFSMHYVGGANGISGDYWGHFADITRDRIMKSNKSANRLDNFVAMMSQGTSGDLHWMDYSKPKQTTTAKKYAKQISEIAFAAYEKIAYRKKVDLGMAESKMTFARRLPDQSRRKWAEKLNTARGDRLPRNQPEVYANQALWIQQNPKVEIVLQTIRIGDVGITAIPNEVFGVTGLKIKTQSPLKATFNMSLANGAAGYIPPPEQHRLGGYTTWPARTAGLEVGAEPKIVERLLGMLEKISSRKRRPAKTNLYPESIRSNIRRALQAK